MGEKGKKKSRILLIVCGLLLLAGAIIGIVMFRMQAGASAYNESIKTAEKYADSGEYELAVLTYENAIKDRPKEEEGYLGLADVYLKRGESSAAKVLLQRGYMHTNSSKIQYMLSGIKDGSLLAEFDDSETKKETMQSFGVFSFNTAFLQKLENYDYTDYCDQFGSYPQIVKTGKGEVEVVHKDLAGTCCYSNTKAHDDIVNVKTDKPAKDGMPEIVRLDSISQLFRNFSGKASLAELNAISSSKVAPITDEERVYVELSTGSLLIRVETDASGNIISDKAWNEIILKEANENRSENGTLNGVVIDAMTGEGVPAAKLEFKAKENAENSTHVTSGKDGSFSIELAADVYEVTISADGYVDETFEFEMEKDKNYSGEQFTISPELAAGSARIVLEWTAQPQDLDSYRWGNTDKGDDLYVNFRKRTCEGRDGLLAELDVDDTNGYGPETITLNDLNGVYTYSVVDYRTTGTLQQYGATVKVYLPGKSAPTVITLDPNAGVENVWEVFELDHGELKILNRAPAEENLRPGSK